jgi:hypothetical protein
MTEFIAIADRYRDVSTVETIRDGLQAALQKKCDRWSLCGEQEVQATGRVSSTDETGAFWLPLTLQHVVNSIQSGEELLQVASEATERAFLQPFLARRYNQLLTQLNQKLFRTHA